MKHSFSRGVVFLLLTSLYVNSGCAENEKTVFAIPDTLTLQQTSWERESYISANEEELLELTIERNPGIADFEELEGELVSYREGSGRKRYYWVIVKSEFVNWFYLEFEGNEFTHMESGSGKPFVVSD